MNKKIIFISVLTLIVTFSVTAQIFEPVRWKFEKKLTGDKTADLIFRATIDDGWHLYGLHIPDDGPRPTSFAFETLQNAQKVGEMQSSSKLIENYDANFGMTLNWYNNNAVFVQKITFDDPEKVLIEGYVEFMTCNDESCLPPAQEEFVFKFSDTAKKELASSQAATTPTAEPAATGVDAESSQQTTIETDAAPDYWTPVIDELRNYGNTAEESNSFWWIFLLGFGGGLIA
jgi:thiol:disulfide interchange protein DsbD